MSIHIIPAVFTAYRTTTTKPRNQWDYGQVLNVAGIDLPEAFEAHFCCEGDHTTVTQIGQNGLVEVPYEYMETGRTVLCFIFLHDSSTDGRTMYTIRIPIVRRPRPTDLEPTPVQQDAIAEAIVALNNAIVRTDASAESARADAESAQASATTAVESAQSAQASATSASASADSANQSATSASQSATSASASASSAERDADRAEMAAMGSGYFDVEIDERDHLIYTRTDNVRVDFALDNSGHLIMEED
jgi:hypothetical protein